MINAFMKERVRGMHPDRELDSQQGWRRLVDFYYEFRSEGGKFNLEDRARISESKHMKALLSKMNLQRKKVLDAGCGFGYYSFFAAQLGAIVTAVDFAPEMIDLGRKLSVERNVQIEFRVADISDLSSFENGSFDVVISGMDLEMPDINLAFSEFARILVTGGQFLFSVPHPITHHGSWQTTASGENLFFKLDNYFTRGPFISDEWFDEQHRPVRFRRYRRPIQDYTEGLANNNFVIARLLEGEPPAESKDTDPVLYNELKRVPCYLIIQAVKI